MKKLVAAIALCASLAASAESDGYFMMSVLNPAQLPTQASTIYGVRLSAIYGECFKIYGVDAGLSGYITERMLGVQAGGLNFVGLDQAGVQIGALGNWVNGDSYGLQVGIYNAVNGRAHGLYVSGLSIMEEVYGAQFGVYQYSKYSGGAQIGLVNTSRTADGVQIGLVNWSESLRGVQIGLWNIIEDAPWPQMPFVNWCF